MNENKLRELFEKGSITEIRQAVYNYPVIKERVLAWAVERGNAELVHYVMNRTTPEEYDKYENTPLEYACLCGNYSMVKFIAENEKSPYFSQDNSLFYAAAYGDRGIIRCLIENGYDINMKDGYGGNALEWAAQENRISNAKMLIEGGCDVNNLNGDGMTALYTACAEGNADMARLLLDNNAEPDRTEDATPLIIASCYGKIECVKLLLEHGTDVNTIDNEGRTALFYAMVYRQDEVKKLLSDNGASYDICDKDGVSPTQLKDESVRERVYSELMGEEK